MDEYTLRRPVSPPEVKDLAGSVYKSGLRVMAITLVLLTPFLVGAIAGMGAMVGATSDSVGVGALIGAIFGLVVWVIVVGLGCAIGIPLGLSLSRNRLESRLGPHRELVVTWYPHGYSIADWKGSNFVPFADVRRARWGGRRRQFVIVRTAFRFDFAPDRHGIPTDLVPGDVLQRWTDEGLLR